VKWEEVEHLLKQKDPGVLVFEADQVLKRVDKMGDLFAPVLELKQKLPKLAGLASGKPAAAKAGLEMSAQAEVKAGRRKTEAQSGRKRPAASRKRHKI
jgi:hypothetical protein